MTNQEFVVDSGLKMFGVGAFENLPKRVSKFNEECGELYAAILAEDERNIDFDDLPWSDRDFGDEDDYDGYGDEGNYWDDAGYYGGRWYDEDDVIWNEEDIDDGGDEARDQGDGFYR